MDYKQTDLEFPKQGVKETEYRADFSDRIIIISKINDNGSIFYKFEFYKGRHQECLLQTDKLDVISAMCNYYQVTNPLI